MVSNLMKIWTECLIILEGEVTSVGYNTWIKDINPININEQSVTLGVDNPIIKNMVEMRYADLIKNTVKEVTGRILEVNFVLNDASTPSEEKNEVVNNKYRKYTFDNFVVGSSNKFAQSAALGVAEQPGYFYNPLFLYGGVGLGKTHLMHAIGNYIKDNDPDSKITFISAEDFTNELINSIKDNKNQEFRNKYRNIDVLLVDDIQFIAGKTATEEEFFHTFNALHEANKQIVLTSDRPPSEIKSLAERLKSRFGWGLTCDIQIPDYETRMAILKKKAQNENVVISDEILDFIAQRIKTNIRELEGVFNRVIAYRGLINKEITIDVAMEALKGYGDMKEKNITPEYIIEVCSKFYNVKKEDIYSEKRTNDIAFARQVAIYIIKELTTFSYPKIGAVFGKDHTTAIYAIKKIRNAMEEDISVKSNIEGLINDIKGENN